MPVPEQYAIFPVINASLNGASTVLLLVGRWFIAQRRIAAHRGTMISAAGYLGTVLDVCTFTTTRMWGRSPFKVQAGRDRSISLC